MISKDAALQLKVILEEDFDIAVTLEEATSLATLWIGYFDLLKSSGESTGS